MPDLRVVGPNDRPPPKPIFAYIVSEKMKEQSACSVLSAIICADSPIAARKIASKKFYGHKKRCYCWRKLLAIKLNQNQFINFVENTEFFDKYFKIVDDKIVVR